MPTKTTRPLSPPSALGEGTGECGFSQLSPAALGIVAEFFKVLSEASRLQIVCSLRSGPKNVTEVIEATGLGQANVSKHLKLLAKSGVVTRRQEGVCVYYQIANPFVFQMCELVCNALSAQLQEQHYHLEQLAMMRQGV